MVQHQRQVQATRVMTTAAAAVRLYGVPGLASNSVGVGELGAGRLSRTSQAGDVLGCKMRHGLSPEATSGECKGQVPLQVGLHRWVQAAAASCRRQAAFVPQPAATDRTRQALLVSAEAA